MTMGLNVDTVRRRGRGIVGLRTNTSVWAFISAFLIATHGAVAGSNRSPDHIVEEYNVAEKEGMGQTPVWVEKSDVAGVNGDDDLDQTGVDGELGGAGEADVVGMSRQASMASVSASVSTSSASSSTWASPDSTSRPCDAGTEMSYRYQYGYVEGCHDGKNACVAGEDADRASYEQEQVVVVESINKQVLEMLEVRPEVERVNFASSSDGAKVLASNVGAKRVGALLDDDSDTFMRNDCKDDDKWVVIELSQVAKVSLIELSQYELYSSRVNEFAVYGMHSHPRTLSGANTNGWHLLGKFEAAKKKGKQAFSVREGEGGERWVRYLLIRFLSHHGGESVCAINEIGVFGVSAAEELEAQLAMAEEDLVEGILGGLEVDADSNVGHGVDAVEDKHEGDAGNVGGSSNGVKNGMDADGGVVVNETTGHGQRGEETAGKDVQDTSIVRLDSSCDSLSLNSSAGTNESSSEVRPPEGGVRPAVCDTSTYDETADGSEVCGGQQGDNASGAQRADGRTTTENPEGSERGGGKTAPVASPSGPKGGAVSSGTATGRTDGKLPSQSTPSSSPPSASASLPDKQIPPQPKKGSNLYETLVQELRGTKAQQKAISKSFDALSKNFETLSVELAALTADSGLLSSAKVQERIVKLERRLLEVGKAASAHSNAAVGMLAAVMGSVALQYLESMDGTHPHAKRKQVLPSVVRALVIMNVVVATGLILKYINV